MLPQLRRALRCQLPAACCYLSAPEALRCESASGCCLLTTHETPPLCLSTTTTSTQQLLLPLQGPVLRQEQAFWCVDYCKHAVACFGVRAVAVWRAEVGVHVLGVHEGRFTGLLFHVPDSSAPAFSPDGHALALVVGGRAEIRLAATGEQLGVWAPRWAFPATLPAPAGFAASEVTWGGPERRTLLVKALLNTSVGSRLLLSALSFG